MRDSDINLHVLLEALFEKGCKGRILNESPVMEEDSLYIKETWIEISGESYE